MLPVVSAPHRSARVQREAPRNSLQFVRNVCPNAATTTKIRATMMEMCCQMTKVRKMPTIPVTKILRTMGVVRALDPPSHGRIRSTLMSASGASMERLMASIATHASLQPGSCSLLSA